ncbi:MAG: hypothetical protein ACF8XB_18410 [Planctomycetota bacterium JB042]
MAEAGADVDCVGPVEIRNIHTGHVSLRGLDLVPPQVGPALTITDCTGGVFRDGCSMAGHGLPLFVAGPAALVEDAAAVTFSGCTFGVTPGTGPYPGLEQRDSHVSLFGCDVRGGDGVLGLSGGAGVVVRGGTLFTSGSALRGGAGADGTVTPPFDLCSDGRAGGAGIVLSAIGAATEPVVRHVETDFLGGPGGAAGGAACNPGPSGPAIDAAFGSMFALPGAARHLLVTSPIREGKQGSLTIVGPPGDHVWFVASFAQSHAFVDALNGTSLPTLDQTVIPLGPLPPNGVLHAELTVPVHPSVDSIALMEQVLHWSPFTGFGAGAPRLGVILDQQF